MGKTTNPLWMCVLVLGLACSASADVIIDYWAGTLDIPGWSGKEELYLDISGAPADAYVTSILYRVKVDDQGDAANFWCSDYTIYIGNETHGAWYECVWGHEGGKTDEGADDDVSNDSDIYLYRTLATRFDGDPVNQKWYVAVMDNVMHGGSMSLGVGRLTQFRVEIGYDVPKPDLVDAGEWYRSFSPTTVVAGQPGQNFEVNCRIRNDGDAGAGPFAVSFDLSADMVTHRVLGDTVAAGHVISQDPAGGARVARGAAVHLLVCAGVSAGSPVAHWKLDELKGPIAFDSAGANDGVLYGGPLWLPEGGIIDGALEFDGIDDYVSCGTFNPSTATGKLTVCLWANWNGLNGQYQGLIGKRDSFSAQGMMWQTEASMQTGDLSFSRAGDSGVAAAILPIGEWAHVAVTFDGSIATFYVDGKGTGSGSFSFGSHTTASLVFGACARNGGNSFNGAFDDVRLYDQALSQTQIKVVMLGEGTDVTAPADVVRGVPNDGDWPGDERPDLAIDDNVNTKYLHFKGHERPTGLQITPALGATVVTGLTFTTANDFPGRDPIAFELYGSNDSIDGPYTLIASGDIVDFNQGMGWPRFAMNATMIAFGNLVAYEHYQLLVTAIRGPVGGSVDSMQIAEIELLGSVPGPGPRALLAHYEFEGNAADSISGREGTEMLGTGGPPTYDRGKLGQAIRLHGDGDHVVDEGLGSVMNGLDALTVALWVKSDVTNADHGIIIFEDPANHDDRDMRYDAAGANASGVNVVKISVTSNASGGVEPGRQQLESSSDTQTTQWQHLAMTWRSGEQLKLYIDGVLDTPTANEPALAGVLTGYTKLIIGKGGKDMGQTSWQGLIDDVRIYGYALSADEIAALAGGSTGQ